MRPATSSTARPAVSYDAWRHRYTLGVTGALVALLTAGGLVTSTGSGLAVPDWPLSFGRFFPPMVGGVLFEHGHRLIAATVGLLIVILGAWYRAKEPRPWARSSAIRGRGWRFGTSRWRWAGSSRRCSPFRWPCISRTGWWGLRSS